jgi:hypothetical protein
LLNWKRLRAPAMPYFLRSFARASRVRKPLPLRALRSSAVGHAERAGDAEAQGAGLSGHAAAAHRASTS